MAATTHQTVVPLLDFLSERQAQAQAHGAAYLAPVADENSMVFWLSRACKAARTAAGRKQVHVAAGADTDQSTIARFERSGTWPRDPDQIVSAYADDLDIESIDLWRTALELWAESRNGGADEPPALTPPR